MKRKIYVFTLLIGLWSCNNKIHSESNGIDTLNNSSFKENIKIDAVPKLHYGSKNPNVDIYYNYDEYLPFDTFEKVQLKLNEIKENNFLGFLKNYKSNCMLDSKGFLHGKGFINYNYCDEVCTSYFVDEKKHEKYILPSNYDSGILGILFSPSCNKLVIYSSYDTPDYADYYTERANITCYSITTEQGLSAIKPLFKYDTKDWSIGNITWADDNTLALQLYDGTSPDGDSNSKYRYFKTVINEK
ncbi:MAG: hypothetical protein ABIP95_04695 [Pelobium sp.]